jgi:hypothetical protein
MIEFMLPKISMNNHHVQDYVEQSVGTLRLVLAKGDINFNKFNVLQKGELVLPLYHFKLTARIIGASHLLTFAWHASQLHEILACLPAQMNLDQTVNGRIILNRRAIAADDGHEEIILPGIIYSFFAKTQPYFLAAKWLENLEREAGTMAWKNSQNSIGLAYDFPSDAPTSAIPKTVVMASVDENSGTGEIVTAHSYPNEQAIVQSKSKIQIRL